MRQLFSASWLSRLLGCLVAGLSVAVLPAAAANADSCNNGPVYEYSRALYLEQYGKAEALLKRIESERSPLTADFLRQVLGFTRAYLAGDKPGMKDALREVDGLIGGFSNQSQATAPGPLQLDQASIRVHAARMHLLSGNVLRAVTLGKQAGPILERAARVDVPPDSLLALGLYRYYAGRGDDDLSWIVRLFGFSGDKVGGIRDMKLAIERSPDHAFEAARSLIADLGWNRHQTCPYLPYFDRATTLESLSAMHFKQQISAYLFCGAPLWALDLIAATESKVEQRLVDGDASLHAWLFDARLHAYSMMGDVSQLEGMLAQRDTGIPGQGWKLRFALARAHDVLGERDEAQSHYSALLQERLQAPYDKLLRAYIKNGYRTPGEYEWVSSAPLLRVCD